MPRSKPSCPDVRKDQLIPRCGMIPGILVAGDREEMVGELRRVSYRHRTVTLPPPSLNELGVRQRLMG